MSNESGKFMLSLPKKNKIIAICAGWVFACLVLGSLFFQVVHYPLQAPDGARYAEMAREMVASSDYLTPHLNGIPYFEKPPLVTWINALGIKLFGVNQFAVGLGNILFGIAISFLLYIAMRRIFDQRAAIFASIINASTILFFAILHFPNLDLALTFFLSGALLTFIVAATKEPFSPRLNFYSTLLVAIFCALAVLTKGLVGVVFPGAIILLWITIFKEWRLINLKALLVGLFLFLLITVPWHFLIALKNPEFLHFYFWQEHVLRYATNYAHKDNTLIEYVVFLLLGFFPWTIFLFNTARNNFQALKESFDRNRVAVFFWIWAIFIFVFYAFSLSKLPTYLLPVFVPLAGLVGDYFSKEKKVKRSLWILIFLNAIFMLALGPYVSQLGDQSIKPLAFLIKENLEPKDLVVSYNHYYQDLPFYLERRVIVVENYGELDEGEFSKEAKVWLLRETDFWKMANTVRGRIFIFCDENNYRRIKSMKKDKVHLVGRYSERVVAEYSGEM
jgi:4-amino-4-deoxy-L-arabinose transferase-like glycosyltransferase